MPRKKATKLAPTDWVLMACADSDATYYICRNDGSLVATITLEPNQSVGDIKRMIAAFNRERGVPE